MRVGLVACSKEKLARAAPARELYTSALFRRALAVAERQCDRVYVVSALHGLLPLDELVAPYDHTMADKSPVGRVRWGEHTGGALANLCEPGEVVVFAGRSYADPLAAVLSARGWTVSQPLAGLQIGERLRHLNALLAAK